MAETKILMIPLEEKNGFYMEISDSLQKALTLPLIQTFSLHCGQETVKTKASFIRNEKIVLYASEEIYNALHLPIKSLTLRLQYDKFTNTFKLGPVICVLIDSIQDDEKIQFGNIDDFCKEMANYCAEIGAFFCISTLTDLQQNQKKGFHLSHQNWKKETIPCPDVIYNRIRSRKLEYSQKYLKFLQFAAANDIPVFNHRYLNKWEIHKIFASNQHLLPYLPKTMLLTKKSDLQVFVNDFQDVFIKPINGSQGRRIIRLKNKNDLFEIYFTDPGKSEQPIIFHSFQEMYKHLFPYLKREPHIIQQTIDTIKLDNRPLDFRFLCHKINHQGWKITSSVARLSAKDQFVSNLAKGGELYKIKKILSDIFDKSTCLHLCSILSEIALEAAKTVEMNVEGEYGEFGIDMAVSEDQKPWILEVNTKPSKNIEYSLNPSIRPSAKAIIRYCFLISGYDVS